MENYCGIININKEKDFTSHDVVAIIRKTFGKIKTGHTGTLDPMAEGVLPVCLGKATKLADYIAADIKQYRAILNLGFTTDTDDETGKVINSKNVDVSFVDIEKTINSFIGDISQVPPMYSAIKINGQKLYDIARQGVVIERKSRNVTIYSIKILEFLSNNKVSIDILCSKGTYIRSICRDIGESLGCGGNMGALVRVSSGVFNIESSYTIEQVKNYVNIGTPHLVIIPVEKALNCKKVFVSKNGEKFLLNGNKIHFGLIEYFEEQPIEGREVFAYMGQKLVGLYKILVDDNGEFFIKPQVMLV